MEKIKIIGKIMKTDIEIAQSVQLKPILEIAKKTGIPEDNVELYGKYKAKIDTSFIDKNKNDGKLILVTAITPTPSGEGKTTMAIGVADALNRLGKKTVLALREPSLGPVFGIKGGATGGGYAQVLPMEDINLHFNGDFHAIATANNLLSAMIDNHIYHGNALGIDPCKITFRRAMDMNDRELRKIVGGLGGKTNGVPREEGFDITAASEIMATLCLASSLADLKLRLSKIIVGYSYDGNPITAHDLKAEGAMTAVLKDAIKPNLVQTIEGTPAIIHGGPFANIAHGCNSVIATKTALKLADYVVTEAGFGADLGAEKFLDIKCRVANLCPSAVVIVATIRALKMHGGVEKGNLKEENIDALKTGVSNLLRHIHNINDVFGLNTVVAINKFPDDTDREIELVKKECEKLGVKAILSTVWSDGGKGGIDVAKEVLSLCETDSNFKFVYDENQSIYDKITAVATKIYGADGVEFLAQAKKQIAELEKLGYDKLPVCIAKTQYSFSDDAKKLGAPKGFTITVRSVKVSAGAGFIVALTGDIMTMPGLPLHPVAENIDIDNNGKITGLF